mgnify:CR=1 FL=1
MKGFGGIGKTQIALHYEKLYGETYEFTLFIDCESTERFRQSLKVLADHFRSQRPREAVRNSKDEDLVRSFLSNENRKMLLIVDNVDDQEVANEVVKILPDKSKAHVIITGRYSEHPKFNKNEKNIVPIEGISDKAGIKIFQEGLPPRCKEAFEQLSYIEKKQFILNDLGGVPLAIRQASAYFKTHSVGGSIVTIEEFRKKLS